MSYQNILFLQDVCSIYGECDCIAQYLQNVLFIKRFSDKLLSRESICCDLSHASRKIFLIRYFSNMIPGAVKMLVVYGEPEIFSQAYEAKCAQGTSLGTIRLHKVPQVCTRYRKVAQDTAR